MQKFPLKNGVFFRSNSSFPGVLVYRTGSGVSLTCVRLGLMFVLSIASGHTLRTFSSVGLGLGGSLRGDWHSCDRS